MPLTAIDGASTIGTGLAADTQGVAWLGPFLIGVAVVGLLIGMVFWRGRHGRRRPPRPDEQPSRGPRNASAQGTPRAHDDFGAEGERLSPHEMGGSAHQSRQRDENEPPEGPGTRPGA
ncbi:DUF6479 family protein [Streptomyces sp. NBC_00690]